MSEPTSLDLKDPAVMLETLRLAYRYLLDRTVSEAIEPRPERLSGDQKHELGRRLAQYWADVQPPPTDEERTWHHPQEEDPFIELVRQQQAQQWDDQREGIALSIEASKLAKRDNSAADDLRELDRIQPDGHACKVSGIRFKGKEPTYGPPPPGLMEARAAEAADVREMLKNRTPEDRLRTLHVVAQSPGARDFLGSKAVDKINAAFAKLLEDSK